MTRANIRIGARDETASAFSSVNGRLAAMDRQTEKLRASFSGLRGVITGAVAGISAGAVFRTFLQNTINAQNEQAQLAAVLRSTGEAAGFSATQLNKMATELARSSTFSEGEITNAQTRLLSYTGIVGEQFPQAMQAVIDMAARMGTSVEQSAETIGRALDVPSAGLTALSRQGFRFTEEQKSVIKALEDAGRTAEAQGILLDALRSSYGGAAQAARNTFGGAVAALRNELNNLLTGSDGSLDGTKQAIDDLTEQLQSPAVKDAFASLATAITSVTSALVTGITKFSEFGQGIGIALGRFVAGSIDPLERLDEQIAQTTRQLEVLMRPSWRTGLASGAPEEIANLQRQLEQLRRTRVAVLRDLQSTPARVTPTGGGATEQPKGKPDPVLPDPEAERRAKAAADAARRYLENLQAQLRATENLSVAETVLRDIQEGRLRLAGGVTQAQLLEVARQIDASRELQQQLDFEAETWRKVQEERKRVQDEGRAVFDATRTPAEQLNIELARLQRLLDAGAISWDTFARASDAAQDTFEAATEAAKTALSNVDEFTKRAAENIQRELGDGLVNIMQGNFKDIASSFKAMLDRMVAEAIAAQLARALFGGEGENGQGGIFGNILGSFGRALFGGGRARGGPVQRGTVYEVNELGAPEVFEGVDGRQYLLPAADGQVRPLSAQEGAGGRVVNNYVTVQMPQNGDRQTALQFGRDIARALDQSRRIA